SRADSPAPVCPATCTLIAWLRTSPHCPLCCGSGMMAAARIPWRTVQEPGLGMHSTRSALQPATAGCSTEGDQGMDTSRTLRVVGVVLAFAVLLVGTALVFEAFDSHSHSASDTLRPFIITMFPVWAVAFAGAWALLRSPSAPQR